MPLSDDDLLSYFLFTIAGKNNWNGAPPWMRGNYQNQAQRLKKMLEIAGFELVRKPVDRVD